jgi:hypothetical protein
MNPNQYPAKYDQLIRDQNKIGWNHLYRARWSNEWNTLQGHYLRHRGGTEPQVTDLTWVVGLGRILLNQWLDVWKLRNEQRHGIDQARQSRIREQALQTELRSLYSYKTKVCPSDTSIFHESAEAHLTQHPNLDSIETWIAIHKDAIKASSDIANRLGIRRNRTLHEYPAFNPITLASQQAS